MLIVFTPAVVLLAILCLQWVQISTFGEFSIKVPYVALALVIACTFISGKKIKAAIQIVRSNAVWMLPFALYAIIMGVVQAGTPAATSAPRQAFFLVGAVALAAALASARSLPRTLRVGAFMGLALLIGFVEILARQMGLSWLDAIERFLEGDFKYVFYSFFREVFNATATTDDELGASTKNAVAVSVLILGLLYRSGSRTPARDVSGMACTAVVLGLLLLLNTRSVLIAAGFGLVVTIVLGASMRPRGNVFPLLVKMAAALALVVVGLNASLPADGVSGALGDRFAFDDASTEARFEQFTAALQLIQNHPMVGNGYTKIDGYVIHNLFLSAWVQGGIAVFFLAVIFYGALLGVWLSFLHRMVKRPQSWVLPVAPEWIAPLPIMPLFRMWSSGDGGQMFLGEWIAVACFIGCILANQMRGRTLTRYFRRRQWAAQTMPGAAVPQPAILR